jgi:oxygen-independent coproporphyrinogen-3 oxidase
LLKQEIQNRSSSVPFRKIQTIYFGGGTPSLIKGQELNALIQELAANGFDLSKVEEITIEINPGTLGEEQISELLSFGFNRFSVGVQTFNETRLKELGREHSVFQTKETLKLLQKLKVNFSLDILFAHANQTMTGLNQDLEEALGFNPPHVSAYCLTLPENHPFQKNRPDEIVQTEMIEHVRLKLQAAGLVQYEISNFCRPGFESKNNQIYWGGHPYWGLGMSAHSYFPTKPWGQRFWNPSTLQAYRAQVHSGAIDLPKGLPTSQFEILEENQALTDFCHVRLRTRKGLDERDLRTHFSSRAFDIAVERLSRLARDGYLWRQDNFWKFFSRNKQ